MTRCFRFALALVSILVLSAVAAAEDKPSSDLPQIEIRLRKKDDTAKLSGSQKQVVLAITCPSGIGSALLTHSGDRWPEGITLRLHLSGLESLQISAGGRRWSAEVQSHGERTQLLSLMEDGKEAPLDKSSPDWQEIRILDADGKPTRAVPNHGGYFELSLPGCLLKDQPKTISITWIDFYRG